MKIVIDLSRITLNDLIELEEGNRKLRFIRDLLARFVVDESGQYLPDAEAVARVGQLSVTEIRSFSEQVSSALKDAMHDAIPPVKGGS